MEKYYNIEGVSIGILTLSVLIINAFIIFVQEQI